MTTASRAIGSSLLLLCAFDAAAAADRGVNLALEDVKNLVVMIEATVGHSKTQGAGIIVGADADGLVVITADHVVREGDTPKSDLRVWFNARPDMPVAATLASERIPANVPSSAGIRDLAVLRVARAGVDMDIDALPFGSTNTPSSLRHGDDVNAIGNPGGRKWWVTAKPGNFAGEQKDILSYESQSTDTGFSGGALLDRNWNVIGMVIAQDAAFSEALDVTAVIDRLREWGLPVQLGTNELPAAFETLSLGYPVSCGLDKQGFVYCWGGAAVPPQAAEGSGAKSARPGRILGTKFKIIDAGEFFACGVTTAGAAYCFGSNDEGRLGNPDAGEYSAIPVPVTGDHLFRSLSTGYTHACGITKEGAALCWGPLNLSPQDTPRVIKSDVAFESIACGRNFACALTKEGRAYCWGDNMYGQVDPNGARHFTWKPTPYPELSFRSLSVGSNHACGVTAAGAAYCWGRNDYDELGHDRETDRVQGGLDFAQVSAGNELSCGVTTDGRAYCWGNDVFGGLGDGVQPTTYKEVGDTKVMEDRLSSVPVPIASELRFRAIFAGKGYYACAIARDETVYCWGKIKQRLRKEFGDYGQVPVRAAITASAAAR